MDMLRSVVLLFISFLLPINMMGQSMDFQTRNVIVNTPDSIIKANVWNKPLKDKVNPECNYFWYYAGAINHNWGSYSGKLLHGRYEVFDNQQKLITQGDFENGLMTGSWHRWYQNGNIQFAGYYKNGMLQGTVQFYTEEGNRVSALEYKHGLLDGKSYFFFKDTTITKMYKKGKEVVKVKKVKKPKVEKERPKDVKQPIVPKETIKPQEKPKDKWWKFSFLKRKKESVKKEAKPVTP